jgi:outer membrane receptor protein involved in Fe transport
MTAGTRRNLRDLATRMTAGARRCRPDLATMVAAAMLMAAAPPLPAQACGREVAAAGGSWQAPLDRRVTPGGERLALRDALDRLATLAKTRISYAVEFVPVDRTVCLAARSAILGDVLSALLEGTTVEPVAAGQDHVVLAPIRPPVRRPAPGEAERAPSVLAAVVVEAAPARAPELSRTVAATVITGDELRAREAGTLGAALEGAVPGLWTWAGVAASPVTRFAAIRGASSFGTSAPKVYLDGIEVANPRLVALLATDAVDRIEVLRGPQGAALYGADAIGGVIHIHTRHAGINADGSRLQVRSRTGVASSEFATDRVLERDWLVAARAGSPLRSAGASLQFSSLGDYVPGAASRQLLFDGNARAVGSRGTVAATLRVSSWEAGVPESPLLAAVRPPDGAARAPSGALRAPAAAPGPGGDSADPASVRHYTTGVTAVLSSGTAWTHTVTAGMDGYRFDRPVARNPLFATVDGDFTGLLDAADRLTIRVGTSTRIGDPGRTQLALSLSTDHSALREDVGRPATAATAGPVVVDGILPSAWRFTTGAVLEADLALGRSLFLNGGLRAERNEGYTPGSLGSLLPQLGAAWEFQAGDATVRVRGGYGKAVRPPQLSTLVAEARRRGLRVTASPDLAHEHQSGVEYGVDVRTRGGVSLHVTRFDQQASGLIQSVAVSPAWRSAASPRPVRPGYEWQNVGDVNNRGWELQAAAKAGRLHTSGSWSLVDSRVRSLAPGYSGELAPGDRMLEVPRQVASLQAGWTDARWTMAWTVARAWDWIGYDQVARLSAPDPGAAGIPAGGRDFWRRYPGTTRLGASFTRDMSRGFTFVLAGENLLGYQDGEPDNGTVVPGRTVSAGVRVRIR